MNERGIEEIINALYEMIQEARGVPLSSEKCILEREKALDLMDELINELPGELKQAKTIVESRGEVINNAKRESENILKQAQTQARQMIAEAEVTKQANAEAEAMLQQARKDSEAMLQQTHSECEAMVQKAQSRIRELKKVTNDFVDNALRSSEESITEALTEIRETRRKFNAVVGAQTKPENPAIITDID